MLCVWSCCPPDGLGRVPDDLGRVPNDLGRVPPPALSPTLKVVGAFLLGAAIVW